MPCVIPRIDSAMNWRYLTGSGSGGQAGRGKPAAKEAPGASKAKAGNREVFLMADKMSLFTKAERVAQVTAEGLAEWPAGMVHGIENDLKPKNWGRDLEMIGTSASAGALLRTILPESGAVATAAGLVMGGTFALDGLKPVAQACKLVTTDSSRGAMSRAARVMGDGLGQWTVDGGISMLAGGLAVRATPGAWRSVAPKTWESIESFKATHLAGTSPLATALTGAGTSFSARMSALADRLDPPRPGADSLSADQLSQAARAARSGLAADARSESLYRNGMTGSDGHSHGLDGTVELLLAGRDPIAVPAAGKTAPATLDGLDLSQPNGIALAGEIETPSGLRPLPSDTAAGTVEAGRDAGSGTAQTEALRILNLKTMSAQAQATRASLGSISDVQGMVMDAVNRTTGAVDVRTNPKATILKGYDEPVQSMFSLAEQVNADPANFVQVGDLFTRFADAAVQSGTGDVSDIGAHIGRFNRYAQENLTTYQRNIIKAGIDPQVALKRKVVAPLGEATSDVQQIGVDNAGNPVYAHEGPHTVRAIYGPHGEPVWPIDLIKYPIREMGMRGVQPSGIYGHELMHDQFGRLGEFDPEVRDAKLGDAAARALGADAGKTVNLPNGGVDPQKVLLNNIERQAAQIDPARKDAFLTEALQLDPQSKVVKAAQAADKVLGANGRRLVQVPGNGRMPLDVFVANIAAMADTRSPVDVLAEAQGKGNPAATEQLVSSNVDKILGGNGESQIPQADGSTLSLKDTVLKVSAMSRNPHFHTYGEPLPGSMTNQEILVNLAKAWADETFADWGAAAESGQTAPPYFQALRKDGMLSRGTVMGQEMRSADNPLGIEAHPVDKLRPRYQAALIRALATAKGGHDQLLLDWADALDKYSRDAGQPGDIKIASMDAPGQSITIPETVMDRFIPELVHQQLSTPLPRLEGRTLFDILPDLRKNFRVNDSLSDKWVEAISKGASPETVPFDPTSTKITHVFGAGQLAFLKLVAGGMEPIRANEAVNQFSDYFGNKFLASDPHAQTTFAKKLQIAPRQTISQLPTIMSRGIANTLRAQPAGNNLLGRFKGNALAIASGSSSYLLQDLLGLHNLQQNMLAGSDAARKR